MPQKCLPADASECDVESSYSLSSREEDGVPEPEPEPEAEGEAYAEAEDEAFFSSFLCKKENINGRKDQ